MRNSEVTANEGLWDAYQRRIGHGPVIDWRAPPPERLTAPRHTPTGWRTWAVGLLANAAALVLTAWPL